MRIDVGPTLAEIRSSTTRRTVVVFFNSYGEQVRGRVLAARLDPGAGMVSLVLEEEKTGLIWFARYRCGTVRCASGEIVPWNPKRNEIENMSNGPLWRKCLGE